MSYIDCCPEAVGMVSAASAWPVRGIVTACLALLRAFLVSDTVLTTENLGYGVSESTAAVYLARRLPAASASRRSFS